MAYKKLIPLFFLKDGVCYEDESCTAKLSDDAIFLANSYNQNGADEIIIMDLSYDDASHEEAIGIIRQIGKQMDIPMIVGGNVARVEDVKKYLYAGAKMALLETGKDSNMAILKEVCHRFGEDKIGVWANGGDCPIDEETAMVLLLEDGKEMNTEALSSKNVVVAVTADTMDTVIAKENVVGVTGTFLSKADTNFMEIKKQLSDKGIEMNRFESAIPFSEFKLNSDGLIPVVVQDYKTDEVLMVAYMNEEAYNLTIATGKMTYYSRSRNEIWVKGLTSGHFQYVMSMEIDCDNDTILAKVKQIGAACHTGNRSCFYRNLVKKEYAQTNPLKVFNDVMNVILDRKEHPKEGSYTNYLFDKGIDKILKKCGEEATEIVIAAKNPDPEEIKYEISDFLYHVMVLMAVKDVSWEDIVKELANR